jgi:hypothetical protein
VNLTFESYRITATDLVLHFVVINPAPGAPTSYDVHLSEDEMQAASTNALLRALVTEKLVRQRQATAVASRLDPLLGVVLTI